MRELCEFRVNEEFAGLLFGPDEGVVLGGWIRKVVLSTADPRFARVGELQAELTASLDRCFFYGWHIRRHYSRSELAAAELFLLRVNRAFEPTGEECGTEYDDTDACPYCGAGGIQRSNLRLDLGRIPKRADIARTIADEVVISRRVAEILAHTEQTARLLAPIRSRNGDQTSSDRLQLLAPPPSLNVLPPTRAAGSLFDDPSADDYKCPVGHLLGLNLLSELSVERASYTGDDIVTPRQFVGVRRGLLRPTRPICISQNVRRALEANRARGFTLEVVHFV